MRRFAPLLLALAPFVATAAEPAPALEVFVAGTHGTITVAADGSVAAVELEGARLLGADAIAGFENHIRGWRFEPVLEDGKPVIARARMGVSLVAARTVGENTAAFGIRDVWFVDTPAAGEGGAAIPAAQMPPPRYPSDELRNGIGAEVVLRIEMGADGRVARAAAERVSLRGDVKDRYADSTAARMAKAAESAAVAWRIPGYETGSHVRVPVNFNVAGAGWSRYHGIDWTPAAWILEARAKQEAAAALSPGGTSSRLTLLSALPAIPGFDEG